MFISKSPYSDMDRSILFDEYARTRAIVNQYNTETPFYVYCLCFPDGTPFYFGKGKNLRAFDHLKNFIRGNLKKKMLSYFAKLNGEPPIMFIVKGNLGETEALDLESHFIQKYYNTLANVMPHGVYNEKLASAIGGHRGGIITKERKLGIFSPDYDRGIQSRKNFELGLMHHIDFVAIGKIAGTASVKSKSGIHAEENKQYRSEWAKIGAAALAESGNRSGTFSKKWREENKELYFQICSRAGKVGGKTTGSKPWWTDGIINIRSYEKPDGNFIRGMTKKRKIK